MLINTFRCRAAASLATIAIASSAQAAVTFSYGLLTDLGANTYSFPVYVKSDASLAVRGAELYSVIGDGGLIAGGTTAFPNLISVDLKPTGGLFAGALDLAMPVFAEPQANVMSISLLTGTPASVTIPTSNALLAVITFNSTGLVGNQFTLTNNFDGTSSTVTPYPTGSAINVVDQTATITIPEPAALGLFGLGVVILLVRRRNPLAA